MEFALRSVGLDNGYSETKLGSVLMAENHSWERSQLDGGSAVPLLGDFQGVVSHLYLRWEVTLCAHFPSD